MTKWSTCHRISEIPAFLYVLIDNTDGSVTVAILCCGLESGVHSHLTTHIDFFFQFRPYSTIWSIQRISSTVKRDFLSLTLTRFKFYPLESPCCIGIIFVNSHMSWFVLSPRHYFRRSLWDPGKSSFPYLLPLMMNSHALVVSLHICYICCASTAS